MTFNSWLSNVVVDHTFTVTGTTPQTLWDPAAGTLVDGNGTALTAALLAKLKWKKIIIANRDATLDLWITIRNRSASSTTNDPSSTRGFVLSPKQATPVLDISEEAEIRICNSSGAATSSNVWAIGGQ